MDDAHMPLDPFQKLQELEKCQKLFSPMFLCSSLSSLLSKFSIIAFGFAITTY
ncbi:hypothetical protein Fmac_032554 [Flemingia macrophylla]|uniref:Uncharacterized protein n=1 Tax=Flemingia macrophylla TaxID=520843 RepID=A0ABD1L5N3_9FABA